MNVSPQLITIIHVVALDVVCTEEIRGRYCVWNKPAHSDCFSHS